MARKASGSYATFMDPSHELIAVYYTEFHSDKTFFFIGLFSSAEKAQTAQDTHTKGEKARFPYAYISKESYTWNRAIVDCPVR